jgi:hypothetical protein
MGKVPVSLLLFVWVVTFAACGDKAIRHHENAGPDLSGGADQAQPASKGPLLLKLEQVDIREHGNQGTKTLYEVTTAKVLICTSGLACKKTCSVPLGEADYQSLVQVVRSSGFMTSAKKKDHCMDDAGYERITAKLSEAGKTQTAIYEGQAVYCMFKIDPAAKAVYSALGQLAIKALSNTACN